MRSMLKLHLVVEVIQSVFISVIWKILVNKISTTLLFTEFHNNFNMSICNKVFIFVIYMCIE